MQLAFKVEFHCTKEVSVAISCAGTCDQWFVFHLEINKNKFTRKHGVAQNISEILSM